MAYNTKKIKQFRRILNINQTELATILGISLPSYSLKEQGKRLFNINEMTKATEYFSEKLDKEMTVQDLFFTE